MTNLSGMTKTKLLEKGLSQTDIEVFIELRSRVGSPTHDDIANCSAFSTQGRSILIELITEYTDSNSAYIEPAKLTLNMSVNPPVIAEKVYFLLFSYTRFIEKEEISITRPFSMRGPSTHVIFDISQEHIIEIAVIDTDNEINKKWTFYPATDFSISSGAQWVSSPPLREGEEWLVSVDIWAKLRFDTIRTAVAQPYDDVLDKQFLRAGQYQVIGNPTYRFDQYRLSFAALEHDEASALSELLAVQIENASSYVLKQDDPKASNILGLLSLVRGDLDFDGNFKIERSIQNPNQIIGWVWVLTGPNIFIGFQPNNTLSSAIDDIVIFLPQQLDGGDSLKKVPFDVSEQALLSRPDLFADDPGTNCHPFDNPSRILGEKRFSTVLRVTQPFVEGSGQQPLTFEDQLKRDVDYPRRGVSKDNLIEYEGEAQHFQAKTVALGHILEHAVRYRSNGYSLGDVAYSMTLAPRQKRRILKVDYERRERNVRREETVSGDEVLDSTTRDLNYENSVSSELDEWSRGKSNASSTSASAGLGISFKSVVIGGGAVTGKSSSSSSQEGGRSVAAFESQQLRDAIRRFGQSLRSLESTVVSETHQTESIEGVSEVVQNINYTRSLSVIYYEILRHLRVDTEITGVTECIFVPMPILPWNDNARLLKHRRILGRYARSRLERDMFKYLDDIVSNFTDSSIPIGTRAAQNLNRVSGSLFIQIGIQIPSEGPELEEINKNTDRTIYERESARLIKNAYLPFAALLSLPISVIVNKTMSASEDVRNQYFQNEIAPHMARNFLNTLKIKLHQNGVPELLKADFTMVGNYRFGKTVRVDFTIENTEQISRELLEKITVLVSDDSTLPERSFVNVRSGTLSYSNNYYEGVAHSDSGSRDLVNSESGQPDPSGALLNFRLTQADQVNLRKELKRTFISFQKRLSMDTFLFHKAIWWNMDPDALYTLLDGFALSDSDGRSLASIAEHRPIAIMGNTLVFRTRTDKPLDAMFKSFEDLKNHYTGELPHSDPMRISLPTDGLYARAHLDGCVAAEEHNGSHDWVFDNIEPELADFPLNMFDSRRAEPQNMQATPLPETIINLQNAPGTPNASGIHEILAAVSNPNAFRDMAGLTGTQGNLRASIDSATSLASSFGKMALERELAQIQADATAGRDLKAFGAATQKLRDEGGISAEQQKQSNEAFAQRRSADPANESRQKREGFVQEVIDQKGSIITEDATGSLAIDMRSDKPVTKSPDPDSDKYVVAIPPNQMLFMNFETDSDKLKSAHKDAIRVLVGELGLSLQSSLDIEGHASRSGTAEHNKSLAQRRADNLFKELNAVMSPLNPEVNFTPNFVHSAGSTGSYRERFQHIEEIANVSGAGHLNDPVEKAVLLKYSDSLIETEPTPRIIEFLGIKIEITNRIVNFNNFDIYCLENGGIQITNTVDNSVVFDFTENINNNFTAGDITVSIEGNSLKITNINGSIFIDFDGHYGYGTPRIERIKDQKYTEWRLSFKLPKMGNDAKSVKDILKSLVKSSQTDNSDPDDSDDSLFNKFKKEIIDTGTDIASEAAYVVFLKITGLEHFTKLFEQTTFGTISFDAEIKSDAKPQAQVKGKFSGQGILVGAQRFDDDFVLLNNQTYQTKNALSIEDWSNNQKRFTTYGYFNQGLSDIPVTTLNTVSVALNLILEQIIPPLRHVPGVSVIRDSLSKILNIIESISSIAPSTAMHFQAFHNDELKIYEKESLVSQLTQLYISAVVPETLAFVKK